MATIAELEAYMDKIEERYSVLYPNPQEGQRVHWESLRGYICRVKNGDISGTTPETETPRAIEAVMTVETLCEALERGEPVKPRSFGSFNIRSKRGRVGRNPRTGVEAPITPRRVVTFKPSPVLVARVNGETIADEEE